MVTRKSPDEVERMREAGRVVAEVLAMIEAELRPGITSRQLDALAEQLIRRRGATPSFKGYHGYPASVCISVDDEVVHAIPGNRAIREGQVVSVDAGAIVDGYHGDGARTFVVGAAPCEVTRLVDATRQAMLAGIAAAVPGNRIGDISAAVEDVARAAGFGIVRQYVGHGIGRAMHEDPQVPNFRAGPRGMQLQPGICLAIEPMLTMGGHEVETRPDGWTVVTCDGSLAAHFEHTIVVTDEGPEILTAA